MKKLFFYLVAAAAVSLSPSCKGPNSTGVSKKPSPTLFSVGDTSIDTEEFAYVYKKNNVNNDSVFQRTDVNDYLDLFINFKLKVKEAEALGMDTTQAFREEFNTYKSQLSKPYLNNGGMKEKFIKEAYDRFSQEVKAAHILIRVTEDAMAKDTLEAYNKIMDLRRQFLEGKAFSELATEFSEDPSAKNNGGSLGYFTSMQMVYPFEDAAYKTPVGEVSQPIRTRFGYHLIKVDEKRPARGKVETAHIMIRATQGMPEEDSVKARKKIYEIHKQLVDGGNWNELASQFSEDLNSKDKGGKLTPFGSGAGLPPTFEAAAFELKEKGDISEPILTPYGWHILRLEGKMGVEPFEELEPMIKNAVNRDARSQLNKASLIKRLKNENDFVLNETVKQFIIDGADSTLTSGEWSYKKDSTELQKALFTIQGKPTKLMEFTTYVEEAQTSGVSSNPAYYMNKLFGEFEEKELIANEELNLSDKYIDYRMLVKEYREGILLFKLMDEKVWTKAVSDTVGLRNYFESNQNKYMWEERMKATVYNVANEKVLGELKGILSSGDSTQVTKEALEEKFNEDEALTVDIKNGLFEKGDLAILDKIESKQGEYTIENGGRVYYIIVEEVLPPSKKKLKEVRGEVISDYQTVLEKEWLKELKAKYPVEVNEKELEKVLNEFDKTKS